MCIACAPDGITLYSLSVGSSASPVLPRTQKTSQASASWRKRESLQAHQPFVDVEFDETVDDALVLFAQQSRYLQNVLQVLTMPSFLDNFQSLIRLPPKTKTRGCQGAYEVAGT